MQLYLHRWCRTANPSDTEKLVFLHGLGGVGALWRPVAASLEKEFEIIAPDQRGHGKSLETKGDFSPEQYGTDLTETLGQHQIHPAWIIGHSMGVRSACAFSHQKPEWTKGLVLIDLGLSGLAGGGIGATLEKFLSILPEKFESRDEAKEKIESACPDAAIAQYLMAGITIHSKTSGEIGFPFKMEAILQTISDAKDSEVRQRVHDLANQGVPILILRGENSSVWSKEDFIKEQEEFAESESIQFLEVEGTGHGLPFEKRKEFVEILKKFIQENS